MRTRISLLSVLYFFVAALGFSQPIFLESEGIVRVDLESAEPLGQWVLRNDLPGFIGDGYLEFEGPNFFNAPGNSLLSYKIRITTPGTYRFRWHSRITEPGENTDFNDSWLRFPDADLVYGERNGSRVFPHGSGMSPNPEGSGSNNWLKAYQNRRDEWFWGVFTSDNDPHDIYAEFNTAGDYTVEIAGRSTGHAIDRFVMLHSSASLSVAQDLTQPESERITTSVRDLTTTKLELSPNPATDFLSLQLPQDLPPADYKITISDVAGKAYRQLTERLVPSSTLQVSINDLPAGTYLVVFESGSRLFLGKFVK